MTAHILMVDNEPDAQDLFRQHFRREIRKGLYAGLLFAPLFFAYSQTTS